MAARNILTAAATNAIIPTRSLLAVWNNDLHLLFQVPRQCFRRSPMIWGEKWVLMGLQRG